MLIDDAHDVSKVYLHIINGAEWIENGLRGSSKVIVNADSSRTWTSYPRVFMFPSARLLGQLSGPPGGKAMYYTQSFPRHYGEIYLCGIDPE